MHCRESWFRDLLIINQLKISPARQEFQLYVLAAMLPTKCTLPFPPCMPPQQSAMIVRRSHSRSPHLREPVREIHSLRTGRFHGAPGRAMNLPCPVTPHHETVTRLFREKPATGQPPSRNSRLHESHFTNPTSQILPLAKQPDQTISKLDRSISKPDQSISNLTKPPAKPDQSISNPTKPPAKPDQTISNQTSPSATQPNHQQTRPNHQQPDQTISNPTKLPTTRPNSSRPKNHPPARELPADQRTTSRPSCPISRPCRR